MGKLPDKVDIGGRPSGQPGSTMDVDPAAFSEASEFPSLLSIDPVQEMAMLRARTQARLRESLEDMRQMAELSGGPQRLWRSHLENLLSAVNFLSDEEGGDKQAQEAVRLSPERLQQLAQQVRDKRMALGLSVERLAERAGLSPSTIKNVEKGEKAPTRTTLFHLAGVSELGLSLNDLIFEAKTPEGSGNPLNCYIAPGFDPVKMVIELHNQLNGPGGYVEQTNVYLDHQSAVAYLQMANQPDYVARFRSQIPLDRIAQRILEATGRAGIDVVALGSGDAKEEVRLVQHLLAGTRQPDLRLYLLDISQPLLTEGYKHAADTLADQYGVAYFAMQGNFHHLPRYTQLHYTPTRSHRRRLICMLGRTMANLEDEPRFFRHNLVGCAPNDLLLFDMQLAYAPADQPEEIRRRDPALCSPLPAAHTEWLTSPIWRHCKGVSGIEMNWELVTECPVPGSYTIEAIATVRLAGRQSKRFSMLRWRRYDPARLANCVKALGWELLADLRYGDARSPAAVMLFQRRTG